MNLRSPIFRKLFLSATLLIAATLAVLDFYLARYMAHLQVENVEERLEAQARLLAPEAATIPHDKLEDWARKAGARARARVTFIDIRGVVLADSEHDPETMENHANRPEVREALRSGRGASTRHSRTLDRDLCYVAIPMANEENPRDVLRLAVPIENVDEAVAAVRWRILAASLGAALVVLAVAFVFSRSFTHRIDRLRAFAENLVESGGAEGLASDADDELGSLARSLDRAARLHRDLVERLSLESARREAILASMVEGVLAVDSELRLIFCNRSFAKAVGAKGPVRERLPLLELVRDPEMLDTLSQVLVTGEPAKRRLELSMAAGRAFEVQVAPLAAPSHRGAIAILHDVSDLERLERVRKDFVANVSHELRTPLTAIRGYAETLLDGALDDQENNRRFLEVIRAHAVRLNNIASDLLTLSELESGKPLAEPERVPLVAVIDSALRTVEAEARIRDVKIHSGPLEAVFVLGDRMRLEQALINLLDNAIKFNRQGGEVTVVAGPAEGGKVRVIVSDTGVGIPSEDLSRIFERFYRSDKARSREMGGTGLGLAIVKHIVERTKGSIEVESTLGKGSTFTVYLPAA
ncbi:MAG: PAS domain-containing protein [Acidobacteria bacterium]|nr:PAS domain-containing protein [Acidobacteriota bacterium]